MRPLFTIHGGEYLVGSHIERHFKHVNVWVPSRDTGVDLLVSDRNSRRAVSLQVKFSKDYLVTHMDVEFQKNLRACGYWTINKKKLRESTANFWVFVLLGFEKRSTDFIVIEPKRLLKRLQVIHKPKDNTIRSYFWVTERKKCWEARGRGLGRAQERQIANGTYENPLRDFTKWLNAWKPIEQLNR